VDFGMMIATEQMVSRYEKWIWKAAVKSKGIDQPDGKRS
jgi:hypothetical protein